MLAYTREKLAGHLLEIPDLTNLYEKKDPNYSSKVLQWMKRVEDTLQQVRSPQAGFVAAQRGLIEAVPDGYKTDRVDGSKSTNRRKASRAATASGLATIQGELGKMVEKTDQQFESIQEKLAQLLAVASGDKPIPMMKDGESMRAWCQRVWKSLPVNGKTQGMIDFLAAALKHHDLMYLLEDTLRNILENRIHTEE